MNIGLYFVLYNKSDSKMDNWIEFKIDCIKKILFCSNLWDSLYNWVKISEIVNGDL